MDTYITRLDARPPGYYRGRRRRPFRSFRSLFTANVVTVAFLFAAWGAMAFGGTALLLGLGR